MLAQAISVVTSSSSGPLLLFSKEIHVLPCLSTTCRSKDSLLTGHLILDLSVNGKKTEIGKLM